MISFDQIPKLYLVSGATDLRKGINGYSAIVQSYLKMKPMDDECLFIFCNKHHNKIKCLYWDGTGFWLLYKRLEKGTFKWDKTDDSCYTITHQQLKWLLEGLNINQKRAFKRVNYEYI